MSKNIEAKFIVPIVISVPDSVAEFDTAAGREGACLDLANGYTAARNPASEFRGKFLDALGKQLELPMRTKTVVGDDGTEKEEICEKELEYYTRLRDHAGFDEAEAIAEWKELAQSIADTINWGPRPSNRGRIGQDWLNNADKFIVMVAGDPGMTSKLLANLANTGMTIRLDAAGSPVREDLAVALKISDDLVRKDAANRLLG